MPTDKISFKKKMLDVVGTAAFDGVKKAMIRAKDIAAAEKIGERVALLVRMLDGKHRRRTASNLELIFPDWTSEERHRVGKEMYRHFGRILAEFLRTEIRTKEEILATTKVEGMEHFQEALDFDGGVVWVTGHFGCWERIGNWVANFDKQLTVVARDAEQDGVTHRMTELRRAAGLEVAFRGSAARTGISCLKKKGWLGILPDQNSGEILVPYFGIPVGTSKGPAVLASRTHAKVFAGFCIRNGPGQYTVRFYPELQPVEGYEWQEGMTRAVNLALEHVIREFPEQYLWMHDRWKSARENGTL